MCFNSSSGSSISDIVKLLELFVEISLKILSASSYILTLRIATIASTILIKSSWWQKHVHSQTLRNCNTETYSGSCQTSRIESFWESGKGCSAVGYFAKCYLIDVWRGAQYTSGYITLSAERPWLFVLVSWTTHLHTYNVNIFVSLVSFVPCTTVGKEWRHWLALHYWAREVAHHISVYKFWPVSLSLSIVWCEDFARRFLVYFT